MNQKQLTAHNLGETLDRLCNLDPRGYGVCNILYPAARKYTGAPLTINMAQKLAQTVKPGDIVHILTGFVLLPHKRAETDGIIGSILLARALILALGVKPLIICQQENMPAITPLSAAAGLHAYYTVDELLEYPAALAALPFTKDADMADKEAAAIMESAPPAAVISVECPGANALGIYHNATGLDLTALQSKTDRLLILARSKNIPTFAIGDLGNEAGMAAIAPHIRRNIPYAGESRCRCGCGGGTAAASAADHIITATVSDWGCYGLIAALSLITEDISVMHTAKMEREAIYAASRSGMVDMNGWLKPAIDGTDCEMNENIVSLMRGCVKSALALKDSCATWFEKVIEIGYFENEQLKSENTFVKI